MEQKIDVATWKRREHFELFLHSAQPFFSVTVDVDVTRLWTHCRQHSDVSFSLASLFFALRAINATEPLRLRLHGEQVIGHDQVAIGTTILRPDETFGFARFDPAPTFAEFQQAGQATIARVKANVDLDALPGKDDLIYHSTLPWLRFTSFTNAMAKHDSIPRLTFGRVTEGNGRFAMPVAIEVHHALVDGLDVALFVERFEKELAESPLPGVEKR